MVVAHRYNLRTCSRHCACLPRLAIYMPHNTLLLAVPIVIELKMAVTGKPISGDVPLWDRAVTDVLIARVTRRPCCRNGSVTGWW